MSSKTKRSILSVFSCLLLMSSFNVAVSAQSSLDPQARSVLTQSGEKKVFCEASISDDFADNSILIMYDKESSLDLTNAKQQDFSEYGAVAAKDLTTSTRALITSKRNELVEAFAEYRQLSSQQAIVGRIDNESQEALANEVSTIKDLEDHYYQAIELTLDTTSKQQVLDTIQELEKRDDILIVQPNYTYTLCSVPNDPSLGDQWAVDTLNLKKAWDITTGSSNVTVGILDSGINVNSTDMGGRIDFAASRDFRFNINPEDMAANPLSDPWDHGTGVAGIIGAAGNNGYGTAGICWNVKMASLRICDAEIDPNTGSYIKDPVTGETLVLTYSNRVVNAIDHARSKQIPILNCSFSGSSIDSMVENYIDNFPGLVICSAGNDGINTDTKPQYPADFDCTNIISVGASDQRDRLVSDTQWSTNYGKTSVDLFAPGIDIATAGTWGGTPSFWGTSAAAPHVTGVAALIKSEFPSYTPSKIKNMILQGVDKNSNFTSKCVSGGRLNAYNALKTTISYFTVSYNANGGSGTMTDTRVYYGESTATRRNTFTRAGYDFDCWYIYFAADNTWRFRNPNNTSQTGWYKEGSQPSGWVKMPYANGTSVATTTAHEQGVITFYAQWKKYFTVAYNANGGSGSMPRTKVYYGVNTATSKNAFTRPGYTFDCWYIYFAADNTWRFRNPSNTSQTGWYKEGSQPAGWVKMPYSNGTSVATTTAHAGGVITFYAQ